MTARPASAAAGAAVAGWTALGSSEPERNSRITVALSQRLPPPARKRGVRGTFNVISAGRFGGSATVPGPVNRSNTVIRRSALAGGPDCPYVKIQV